MRSQRGGPRRSAGPPARWPRWGSGGARRPCGGRWGRLPRRPPWTGVWQRKEDSASVCAEAISIPSAQADRAHFFHSLAFEEGDPSGAGGGRARGE